MKCDNCGKRSFEHSYCDNCYENLQEEIRQLKYTIRSITNDLIKEKELRKKLEEFIDCSRSSFFKE